MSLTIQKIIDGLSGCKEDDLVYFDFIRRGPGGLHTYRGQEEDLAIDTLDSDVQVCDFIDSLEAVLNTELDGYTGGSYLMESDTPVWVTEDWDDISGISIVSIRIQGSSVYLLTNE